MPQALNPRPINTTSREDHDDAASRYEDRGIDAHRRLHTLVHHHVDGLLGAAVAGALSKPLEDINENFGEAIYHLRKSNEAKSMQLETSRRFAGEYQQALVHCAERILARYHKVRLPVPDDLEQIVAIAAVATGWDYLWPPADERHRHHTDSDGACRNPMCKHVSDEEVPF